MTTSGKSSEPSMEDILASIRKIIADDPVKSDGDAPANPLAGSSSPSSVSPAPRSGPAVISLNSEAANTLDSLLDGAVDEPPVTVKPAGPALPAAPELPSATLSSARSASPATSPVRAGVPTTEAPARARLGSNPLPELKPSIDRLKFDGANGDRSPPYPSLGGSLAARAPANGSQPGARPTDLSRSSLPPAFEEMLAQRPGASHFPASGRPAGEPRSIDLGAAIPVPPPGKGTTPPLAPPAPHRPGDRNGEAAVAGSTAPGTLSTPKSPDAVISSPGREPSGSALTSATNVRQTVTKVSLAQGAPSPAATPMVSSPAKAAALDTSAPSEAKAREPSKGGSANGAPAVAAPGSASPPPSVAATDVSAGVTSAPAGRALGPEPAVVPAQGKTLEDTLAEVLRPVVRQWVIENMPRIVEEVAKQEVAKLPKPDA